jgi:hypothetical protein
MAREEQSYRSRAASDALVRVLAAAAGVRHSSVQGLPTSTAAATSAHSRAGTRFDR